MMGAALHTYLRAAPGDVAEGVPREETGDVVRLRLWGALTAATAAGVRALFRDYVGMGCFRLLVDLEAVESIDAAGLAALLDGRRLVEAGAGGAFYLRVGPVVDRALRQTGTVSAFRSWPDAGA
jgi:anti-anti-sigma factor